VRAGYFQIPIHLWVLLFKVVDQRLIIRPKSCRAQVAPHIGRMILPQVFEQRFSICECLAALLPVAGYRRHMCAPAWSAARIDCLEMVKEERIEEKKMPQ
jgi:hypothetical protein